MIFSKKTRPAGQRRLAGALSRDAFGSVLSNGKSGSACRRSRSRIGSNGTALYVPPLTRAGHLHIFAKAVLVACSQSDAWLFRAHVRICRYPSWHCRYARVRHAVTRDAAWPPARLLFAESAETRWQLGSALGNYSIAPRTSLFSGLGRHWRASHLQAATELDLLL